MKNNRIVIAAGILLLAVTFFGILAYGRLMNPEPVYVLAAKTDIPKGKALSLFGEDDFAVTGIPSGTEMAGSFVTPEDYALMRDEGGQFIAQVAAGEPVKYTDIMSKANPLSSRIVSLGQDDPAKVVMTIRVSGYAPAGIREGDLVDIIGTVTNYDTADAYGNALANILNGARKKALSSADPAALSEKLHEAEFGWEEEPEEAPSADAFGSAVPSVTDELIEKADLLARKTDELSGVLSELREFTELWGSADPLQLSEMLENGYYLAPLSKVLVHGAEVVRVERRDDGYASSVDALDVLVPRDAAEWVAMADEGGILRVALLSVNADPDGSGPTDGVSMQDFLENFADDRNAAGSRPVIPSAR